MAKCEFYFSAISTFWGNLEQYNIRGFNELISYYEYKEHKEWGFDKLHELQKIRKDLMMDSGAFSAFNSGKLIKLEEFIEFHRQLEKECPYITLKAGLDDIGSWENTRNNQIACDEAGINVFPTFHLNDPPEFLDWILERNYPVIAFGGLVAAALGGATTIEDWLEVQYERICDKDGKPKVRTHLFGVSNVELLHIFPATTNDSAAALFTGAYGVIWVPYLKPSTLEPDWQKPMCRISISKESPSQGTAGQHFHNMKKGQKEQITEYIRSQGMDVNLMVERHEERKVFCVQQMRRQVEAYPENPVFKKRKKEHNFFDL